MKLTASSLEQLKTTMLLIQQHQISLDALKSHLNMLIQSETGVDISKGSWSLNSETGELSPALGTEQAIEVVGDA